MILPPEFQTSRLQKAESNQLSACIQKLLSWAVLNLDFVLLVIQLERSIWRRNAVMVKAQRLSDMLSWLQQMLN